MSRQSTNRVALLLIALTTLTGCHPTQPFYFHEDGDLSHYLDAVQEIEYPDVEAPPMPDASESQAPLTVSNSEFKEIWDLSLEECVTIALQNTKAIRRIGDLLPGLGNMRGLGTPGVQNGSIYDPAIVETRASGRPQQNGGIPRGLGAPPTAGNVGGVESALAEFDADLSVFGSGNGRGFLSQQDRPRNITPDEDFFANADASNIGGLRSEIKKKTATGGQVYAINQTDYVALNRDLTAFEELQSDWTTSFELRFDHPLLEGRGTMINRIPIILARINSDISLAKFETNVRNQVFDVENAYWELHGSYRNLETAKTGRDSAQVTWKIVYLKWEEGVEPIQAEAQAREQYFNFRAIVEQSLQQLYDTETQLRYLMGLSATDGRLIRPIDEPTLARVEFDWDAIRTEALVRHPELRVQEWERKQRELELLAAKNRLLPKLDIGAVYKWIGKGDQLIRSDRTGKFYPQEDSTAFEELTRGNYQEFSLFLDFRMPIGFRRELAQVRNAQLQLALQTARIEDTQLQQIHLLSTAVRDVDAFYVQAQTHFNRWSASEKEVEEINELYKGGKSTVDLVLRAQQRRADAQRAYYETLVDYNQAIMRVHFRKGSLLEYNNICLAEGPWPDKAYWDALGRARERDASYYLDYGWTRPGVVTRGPVPQQVGVPVEVMPMPAETVPTPEPTPVDSLDTAPSPEDLPRPDPAPTALRPSAPILNAPIIRTAAAQSAVKLPENPLRSKTYEWGSLGLDAKTSGAAKITSPVRQATFDDSTK